jgi:hypothetical protein
MQHGSGLGAARPLRREGEIYPVGLRDGSSFSAIFLETLAKPGSARPWRHRRAGEGAKRRGGEF